MALLFMTRRRRGVREKVEKEEGSEGAEKTGQEYKEN
jgi:hypothetical protein